MPKRSAWVRAITSSSRSSSRQYAIARGARQRAESDSVRSPTACGVRRRAACDGTQRYATPDNGRLWTRRLLSGDISPFLMPEMAKYRPTIRETSETRPTSPGPDGTSSSPGAANACKPSQQRMFVCAAAGMLRTIIHFGNKYCKHRLLQRALHKAETFHHSISPHVHRQKSTNRQVERYATAHPPKPAFRRIYLRKHRLFA